MPNASIQAQIKRLENLEGEAEFAHNAMLRDIAENIKGTFESDWPVGKPRPGHIHSRNLWEWVQEGSLRFAVINTADYSVYVHNHPNQGGPPALVDRVFPEMKRAIEADPLAFVEPRTAQLFGEF